MQEYTESAQMASWTVTLLVGAAVAVVVTNLAAVTDAELQYGYYDRVGCFGVENRVRTLVRRSFIADVTASAAMLRLAFHDCQVGPVRPGSTHSSAGQWPCPISYFFVIGF